MTDAGTGDDVCVSDELRERIASDPYCATLGIDLLALEPGRAVTELRITDDLMNFHGTPHGGAVYSLADAAPLAVGRHGSTSSGSPPMYIARSSGVSGVSWYSMS